MSGPAVAASVLPTVPAGPMMSPAPANLPAKTATGQAGKADAKTAPHHSRASMRDATASNLATSVPASVVAAPPAPAPPTVPAPREAAPQGASDQCPVNSASVGALWDCSSETTSVQVTVGAGAASIVGAVPTAPVHGTPPLVGESDPFTTASPAPPPSVMAASGPVPGQSPDSPTVSPAGAPASVAASASVAHQLSPALVQLAHGPAGSAVILRLDPAGLGHVQVRIDRDPAGSPIVQVTADHPDTLQLLVADQPQLHRALDSAGIAADGRTLSFALSTPGGNTSGGAGGDASGNQNGGNGRPGRVSAFSAGTDEDRPAAILPAWLRAGVDITA